MSRARLVAAVLTVLAATGCTSTVAGSPVALGSAGADRDLLTGYFAELNEAGREGPTTQRDFLRRTQHPDFTDRLCELGELTLRIEPAMSTVRTDFEWTPEDSTKRPRGLVYVMGVSVSIRRDGAPVAEQIGSQRVVILDGKAYGFTPCPTR
ncbi:hypothetical protein [Actinophytocola sp.]|uniref:hypothetical protein n=1 Tax=Actinophytocola sp. TaxID=1872138 RepID=UPI002D7E780B|nr:hypothetical protein [Actinophytocola sp.]HET9142905.1 hypothetical protein [Actinophytocola sp.]